MAGCSPLRCIYIFIAVIVLQAFFSVLYLPVFPDNNKQHSIEINPLHAHIVHELANQTYPSNTPATYVRSTAFGNFGSIHLLHDACVDVSGVHYQRNQANLQYIQAMNKSSLSVQYEGWSSFREIQLYPLPNVSDSYHFVTERDGYLLWISNTEAFYHFFFSLIGGFKALQLINESRHVTDPVDIDKIQLIYWGWEQPVDFQKAKVFPILHHLYNNTLSKWSSSNHPLDKQSLTDKKCFRRLFVGRASHHEIDTSDFRKLSDKLLAQRTEWNFSNPNSNKSHAHFQQYMQRGTHNDYVNVLLVQRTYPRRHIANIAELQKAFNESFTKFVVGDQAKIHRFKQTRLRFDDSHRFQSTADAANDTLMINVLTVDLAKLTALQQFHLVSKTDILVGVHGSALTWHLLMPRTGIVVEINTFGGQCAVVNDCKADCGTNCVNRHLWSMYAETAQWSQHQHVCVRNDEYSEHDVKQIQSVVENRNQLQSAQTPINVSVFADKQAVQKQWKGLPLLLSPRIIQQIQDTLWNQKFGQVIQNGSRLWCRDACRRWLLPQNFCKR